MQDGLYEAWRRPLPETVPPFASPTTAHEPGFIGSWVPVMKKVQSTRFADVGIRLQIGPDRTGSRLAALYDLAGPQTPDAPIPEGHRIFAEPCVQFFKNEIGTPFRGIYVDHLGVFRGGAVQLLRLCEAQRYCRHVIQALPRIGTRVGKILWHARTVRRNWQSTEPFGAAGGYSAGRTVSLIGEFRVATSQAGLEYGATSRA